MATARIPVLIEDLALSSRRGPRNRTWRCRSGDRGS